MIILDTKNIKPHGSGIHPDVVLYADTKEEVPATGALTKAAMADPIDIPPTAILYTAALEIAVLNTSDQWVWKE